MGGAIPVVDKRMGFVLFLGGEIALFSGVVSLGIGDSFASIIGRRFGRHSYPGKCVWSPACYAFVSRPHIFLLY